MASGKTVGIAAAAAAVAIAIGIAFMISSDTQAPAEPTMMPGEPEPTDVMPEPVEETIREIQVGLLLPFTGDISSHGQENAEGSRLAAIDFNEYLEEQGADWRIKLVEEDTASNPVTALEKVQSLNAKGIGLVVGPETSSNVRNVKGYSDANNMLLVSCCSTAPSLAIEGDSVYRLVPDDSFQGVALSQLIPLDGISVLVPVWRGDTWGDGLQEKTGELFISEDSRIFDEGIRYSPEAVDFSAETSLLAEKVQGYVDEHGADQVAVLYIGFGEVVQFMQAASQHDILDDVRWYGSDANTKEHRIIEDRIASEFAQTVIFTAAQAAPSDNPTYQKVADHVEATLGRSPSTYVHTSYDAVWLVGLSIIETGGTDVDQIKAVFPDVAADYTGAIGDVLLNDAGDLVPSDYEIWYVDENNEWTQLGKVIDVSAAFRG